MHKGTRNRNRKTNAEEVAGKPPVLCLIAGLNLVQEQPSWVCESGWTVTADSQSYSRESKSVYNIINPKVIRGGCDVSASFDREK